VLGNQSAASTSTTSEPLHLLPLVYLPSRILNLDIRESCDRIRESSDRVLPRFLITHPPFSSELLSNNFYHCLLKAHQDGQKTSTMLSLLQEQSEFDLIPSELSILTMAAVPQNKESNLFRLAEPQY
jgi:hypothetical protein